MNTKYREILREVIPAIVFMVIYKYLSFSWAVLSSFGIGSIIYMKEYLKLKKLKPFSYLGIFSLVTQTIMSFVFKNPKVYYVYPLISNSVYALIFGVSLIRKKDIVSYLARDLCEREEDFYILKPAFRKVTIMWFIFYVLKVIIKGFGLMNWSFDTLYYVNFVLGTPITLYLIWYSFSYPGKYYKRVQKIN
ncbi:MULTISPECIES: DUF3159 domain-containing protein [Psychrilyobacter]|uniref:DUF3159 domain-containing protein n=1 Tax=Psychrilyobacter piezotolerans TaxID=2293438 RepID=A0ABX9KE99_9FUSO|nr:MULTISPECIES: DUF3159 domain-containing protein [Psychrilyobacter]MCS5422526.1 DUF3159 domain-containing protein [Psychrilyobacter sp. S5]NDI78734.1 DUF3159 domain-containing protein [Psychrilyobacter piezotolerans]RDE59583.1 DUF3159 domain-containing protein [Psychrilyobacter sp. S5]REI39997.1 DUF3159 domain-containing protein [Psychrilyobacter piezotolerans]